jgi:2-(1,2-epoxy-1,2-dihydrophenyl)acetyl-CoA isomerase
MPTRALVETRHAIDRAFKLDYPAALQNEARVQARLGVAADFAEGVAAFFAKRTPTFGDR